MKKVYVFLAEGFEEIEALSVVDVMRRSHKIDCITVSVTGDYDVTGSHGIVVRADRIFDERPLDDADMLVCPGGIPGTPNLKAHAGLAKLIEKYNEAGKYLAAVCAGPTVYGEMGLLKGKNATCYPGCEDGLVGANYVKEPVVCDGNFITSRGMGTSIEFGLKLTEVLTDKETAKELGVKIVHYEQNR